MWITEEMKQVLKPFSILFNGIELTDYIIPQEDSGRELMDREITKINVPGRAGSYVTGTRTPSRVIAQKVLVACDDAKELQKKLEELSGILHTEKPVPLKFEDEMDRTYFAMYAGAVPGYKKDGFYTATIQFLCTNPYKGSDPITFDFINGLAVVENNGTVSALPIYEIDVLADITHLDIILGDKYIRLGELVPVDTPNFENKTLVLNDSMKSLVGWTNATDVDNGYVYGIMLATQAGFRANNFGTPQTPTKWQGPSTIRSIPGDPIQNFQIDVPIDFLNLDKETGMIEVYLLDAFSNTVAKIGFEDIWQTLKKAQAKFQLGNEETRKVEYFVSAESYGRWNDFKGIIRLVRRGNVFVPYFAVITPDGQHIYRSGGYSYTDRYSEYLAPITQVQVALLKWPGSSTSQADMTIKGIKVWKYNNQPDGVPIIATAGDKIIIDVKKGIVLLNGEEQEDLKDFFSDYFELPKGSSVLQIQPQDKLSGKVIIEERRL